MNARNAAAGTSSERHRDDMLAVAPIGRLMASMSMPSIIGVLAYNLYNILDMLLLFAMVHKRGAVTHKKGKTDICLLFDGSAFYTRPVQSHGKTVDLTVPP